jgi:hypothetical protein
VVCQELGFAVAYIGASELFACEILSARIQFQNFIREDILHPSKTGKKIIQYKLY